MGTEIETADEGAVKDANGNPLADSDSVILIKDLKVKGSSRHISAATSEHDALPVVESVRCLGCAGGLVQCPPNPALPAPLTGCYLLAG